MALDNFRNTIDRLKTFSFGQSLQTAVEDNMGELPEMIREQLAEGKDGQDKPNTIFGRRGYSPKTVEIKQANGTGLGAVTDRITNYMTGDLYESLEMKSDGKVLDADSDVPYFEDVLLYSSPRLLDVDEVHRRQFAEESVMPAVEQDLLQKTGLKVTHR